jgi:type IV pilus biogenesis protein CpaD/CtpE
MKSITEKKPMITTIKKQTTSEDIEAGHDSTLVFLVMLVSLVLALCSGCARFHSVQVQTKSDGTKTESRQTISTFWDSQSSIAKLRASTTDKTQGLTVGGFAEESQSSNVVNVIEAVTKGAVQGAAAALGKP